MGKKVLITISAFLVVILAFGVAYYLGYFPIEPEPQITPEAEEVAIDETPGGDNLTTLVFTEEKINSLLSRADTLLAENTTAVKLDSAQARLIEDKMLLSVSAEAWGIKFEAEDTEIYFQGTEMLVSGIAKVGRFNINFSGTANISVSGGKLSIDIEEIKLPPTISFFVPQLQEKKLIQYLNQKIAEISFSPPIQELEEITIKDTELIIKGR